MKTARKLPLAEGESPRHALIEIDERWGTLEPWQAIRRSGSATPFYLLAAVDRSVDAQGDIITAPPKRPSMNVLLRTFWMRPDRDQAVHGAGFSRLPILMANLPVKHGNTLMIFVLLPFLDLGLVRVAAWIVLLQNEA